mgnify:CR=1 FL=1
MAEQTSYTRPVPGPNPGVPKRNGVKILPDRQRKWASKTKIVGSNPSGSQKFP